MTLTSTLSKARAKFGNLLITLSKVLAGYGYYLVFRYGTEAQATAHLDAALKQRAENTRVVVVPVAPVRKEPAPLHVVTRPEDPYAN
jgi:hypothetical protein